MEDFETRRRSAHVGIGGDGNCFTPVAGGVLRSLSRLYELVFKPSNSNKTLDTG